MIRIANELASSAPQYEDIRVLGPAPAPFAMLRGRYRHRLMIQTPRNVNLPQILRQWLTGYKTPHNIRIMVDVDPYSFL